VLRGSELAYACPSALPPASPQPVWPFRATWERMGNEEKGPWVAGEQDMGEYWSVKRCGHLLIALSSARCIQIAYAL
jgi:hypothetical protein